MKNSSVKGITILNLVMQRCYVPKLEVVGTLAGRFDSTIHSTSFSCNVNWGVKNGKDSS